MIRFSLRTFALLLLAAPLLVPLSAQRAVTPLTLDDAFTSTEFLTGGRAPAISPDGTLLAYVLCTDTRRAQYPPESTSAFVNTKGAAWYSLGCDVLVSPAKGGAAKNVSGETASNWGPAWSPDGRELAFYSDRGGAPHLWIWDPKTGKLRKVSEAITRAAGYNAFPFWLPDGKRILTRLRPEGVSDADLGDAPASAAKSAATNGSNDRTTVTVYRSGDTVKATGKTQVEGGPPRNRMSDLGVINVATGEVKRVAKDVYTIFFAPSPDGKFVLYPMYKGRGKLAMSTYDIVVTNLESGETRTIAKDVTMFGDSYMSWSPDSKRVAYLSSSANKPTKITLVTGSAPQSIGDPFVVPVDGGAPKQLMPTEEVAGFDADNATAPVWNAAGDVVFVIGENRVWRGDPSSGKVSPVTKDGELQIANFVRVNGDGPVWSPAGSLAAVFVRDGKTQANGIYLIQPDGSLRKGIAENKKYSWRDAGPEVSADGRLVVYSAESASQPTEIWTTTAEFTTPVRVTHSNAQLDKYTFGESKLIEYRSADGEPLQATLLLPAGYEPGKRYPMIAVVYASGMGSRSLNNFGLTNAGQYRYHLLTTRGYAILSPDIPVQTGSPMQDLMKGVMPAIDKVVEMGIADPDRLGVTGQSNGGYSTLSLIVQTNRFKAAVMNAGFGDLTGFYGAMNPDGTGSWHPWLERLGGAMGVAPWENPERYVRNSPIYYLDRVTTPLIIQAGGDDESIVPFSDQVFVGLKRMNKNVTYLRYGGEGHLLEKQANQFDYWNRVLPFWDKYLKGGTPSTAP